MPLGPLEAPGTARHMLERAKESSWVTKYFIWLVIVVFCWSVAVEYLGAPRRWDVFVDRGFILLGFFILLIGSLLREFLYSREGRYSKIFPQLEEISAILKEINSYLSLSGDLTPKEIELAKTSLRGRFVVVLDRIGQVFSIVAGAKCRTAIKCIVRKNDKMYVYAFARDSRSEEINFERDRDRADTLADPLEDNEDFFVIFTRERLFYIANDLTRKRNYKNTSFKQYRTGAPDLNWLQQFFTPGWGWPLPYRATMVFPLQQREPRVLHFAAPGCIGFLTIDCASKNAFRERFDGPMGAALAEALFVPLWRYFSFVDSVDRRGLRDGR